MGASGTGEQPSLLEQKTENAEARGGIRFAILSDASGNGPKALR